MTRLLVLGGTGWLGREVAAQAVTAGMDVTCLARGDSGNTPAGARFLPADRTQVGAYDEAAAEDWDAVLDLIWQPGMVSSALAALSTRAAHWVYVSSGSVYADTGTPGADESATVVTPLAADSATMEEYGPAKARCEQLVRGAMGERCVLGRAGLIGGPGDGSDRFGYWVSRFALAADEPVLVPDSPRLSTQTIDVRDLAAFLVDACAEGHQGAVNLVGECRDLAEVLALAADAAGFTGEQVPASPAWLEEHEVQPWAGPRSLPLWLPLPEYAGFGARADGRARAMGLARRPLESTLADTLVDERSRGLSRARRAGLDRADELALIAEALRG
ncbi:MAG: sugar nucleotide-binding protein [Actinomycetota bacterium]|nr:sugar nucleotide-binding protein [Actinomycetota bacterium]